MDAVIEARNVGLISIGILGALWTASSGIGTLIKGLNRIHAVKEQRPFWKRFAVSIGLTLLAGGSLIVAFLVLIIGHVYGLKIANEIGMEGLAAQLFTLSRWPLVIVAVLTAVAFLYWAAPNAKLPFRWLTAGSALFTSAWLLLHYLFGVYLASAPITRPTGRSAASSSSSFGSTSRASCSSSALRSTHSSTLQESGPSAVHRQRRSAPEPRPARPDGWPL